MEKFNRDNQEGIKSLFDESFWALSYNRNQDRLVGIELALKHGNQCYLFELRTVDYHMFKLEENSEDIEEKVCVIARDEILPSDILTIKQAPFSEIREYLTEQDL